LSLPQNNFEVCDGDNTLRGRVLLLVLVGDDTWDDALSMMNLLADCHWLGLFLPLAGNDE
jgi:hypothetical protein